jgi:hypothetical protein
MNNKEKVELLEKILKFTQEGYAGILSNGNIVDRREHPEAIPIPTNVSLNVSDVKPVTIFIDFKITAWERVRVTSTRAHTIIDKIKSGELYSSAQLTNVYDEPESTFTGIISETEEQLTVDKNDGKSTIEILNESQMNTVYKNGK